MFIERPSLSQTETAHHHHRIDNLREIMSDLMLAASWSKKPTKIDEQPTKHDEEIVAESFITTEQHYPTSSLCEIVHEIENFPLSSSSQIHLIQQLKLKNVIQYHHLVLNHQLLYIEQF